MPFGIEDFTYFLVKYAIRHIYKFILPYIKLLYAGKSPKEDFMSKSISVILILVLFFGAAINGFADPLSDALKPKTTEVSPGVFILVMLGVVGVIVLIRYVNSTSQSSEAEAPDDGIKMVSTENETPGVKTDGKAILNVLQHVEASVTPNKDIYVGFRFRY
jgi:hypothetical protein